MIKIITIGICHGFSITLCMEWIPLYFDGVIIIHSNLKSDFTLIINVIITIDSPNNFMANSGSKYNFA